MTSATRARFAQAVRQEPVDLALACCLLAAEVAPEVDVDAALAELGRLSATVVHGATVLDQALALQRALGELAGFAGQPGDHDDLRSSLLPEVLRRRRGLPLLLSVVWVEVAARCGVAAQAVGLPGKVVVRVGGADEHVLVDPFAGGRLVTTPELEAIVRAATGGPLRPEHLDPTDPVDLLQRLLTNVRVLSARDRSLTAARTRLWAVELALLLPRHPFDLRRERGSLLVQLGDHLGGAAELEGWAEAVEGAVAALDGPSVDPATAADTQAAVEHARRDARAARARLN